MSETDAASAPASTPSTSKKTSKSKSGGGGSKKARVKPTHPKTSDMVTAAIKNLKERGGSSLQAIKKYIGANYKVDAEKLAPFIRKYLKSAVTSGSLVQTKGKGASGSFKLPTSGEKTVTKKKPVKPVASKSGELKAKKAKAAVPKKSAVKKSASSVPKKAPVKQKPVKLAPSPSKTKKVKKAPTKKPKAPKPKKAAVTKAKAPKKTAAKK